MQLDAISTPLPILETERLVVRQLTIADVDDATRIFGDPVVGEYTTWWTDVERHGTEGLLAMMEDLMASGTGAFWAIVPRKTSGMIGFCGLIVVPDDDRAEIGYALAQHAWGHHYASEAVRSVMEVVFGPLRCNRLEAYCSTDNLASLRLLDNLGFQHEGTLRQYLMRNDRAQDRAVYSILRSEWCAVPCIPVADRGAAHA